MTVRWFHWLILAVVLLVGAGLRFDRITEQSQWPDEYWSGEYLATGRGNAVFDLPTNVLLDPPPREMLAGAPAWPHIWNGLDSVVHPPLYFLLLRGWMDVFGDSDLATRSFSAALSLAGVLVLFEIVRRLAGPTAGLAAATVMALAVESIDTSQDTRPYTLLALLGILACWAMLGIERRGASLGRLALLGLATAALALTHYFAAGFILGLGAYALLRLRGSTRLRTVAAMAVLLAIAAAAWGAQFWRQRGGMTADAQRHWLNEFQPGHFLPLLHALAVPSRLLFQQPPLALTMGVAAVVYALPLLLARRERSLLIWWCVTVGTVGVLAIYDALHHTMVLRYPRYTAIVIPAIAALAATPLPLKGWRRSMLGAAMMAAMVVAAVDRYQTGPVFKENWRGMARLVDQRAGPREPLVFYHSNTWTSPAFWYLPFNHYVPDSRRPVMMLDGPADAAALRSLARYPSVCLVGPDPGTDGAKMLPGWHATAESELVDVGGVAQMHPDQPAAGATSPALSPGSSRPPGQ